MNIDDVVHGIMSGWEAIEAEVRTGIHDDFGKSKNLQDIIDLIHDLQAKANIVAPLREMFTSHVNDIDNPHQVEVKISDLDVIGFLYELYNEKYGINMSLSDFTYALINIKRFATRADVDANTNIDSVMNIDTMMYAIVKHDDSADAHKNLFRLKLPGTPPFDLPSFIFEPNISITNIVNVSRNCQVNYHDTNGRIGVAEIDGIAIDYAFGFPAVPIFSNKRNVLLNSKLLADVMLVGGTRNVSNDVFILTPTDDRDFLLLMENTSATRHGFTDILIDEITDVQTYLVYVFPIERNALSIDLVSDNDIIVGTALFNLNTNETEVTDSTFGFISMMNALPNGWVRCSVTFNSSGLNIRKFNVNAQSQSDPTTYGDLHYNGVNRNAMGFWQHQLTQSSLPIPPIFTDSVPITILPTKITKDFSGTFNSMKGTIHVKYLSSVSEIFNISSQVLRLGHNNVDGKDGKSSIVISTDPCNRSKNQIVSYNVDGDILSVIASDAYNPVDPRLIKRVEFTYNGGYQGYAFTDNAPHLFRSYGDVPTEQPQHDPSSGPASIETYRDALYDMESFFRFTYDQLFTDPNNVSVIEGIKQFDHSSESVDTTEIIIIHPNDVLSTYKVNDSVNIIELGYNSITDQYLEGYLLNVKYYSSFATKMNLEFLLDQYIQEPIV